MLYATPSSASLPFVTWPNSSVGLTKENAVGFGDSVILLFLFGFNKKLSVAVTPVMQLGRMLWPFASVFNCSFSDAQLLL